MNTEELKIISSVSLDFNNNNIKTINVKQLDTKSRFVNVTCTANGKKMALNQETMSAIVRYRKPDGFGSLNDCEIMEDGTILVELTQQMLAVKGKCQLDIMIFNAKKTASEIETLETLENFGDTEISLLSTMSLYVNVIATALEHAKVTSSNEFEALVAGLSRLVAIESNENQRIANEGQRIENEESRKSNEETRASNEKTRVENEQTRQDNEETRKNQETARVQAEEKREENVTTVITNAETATKNANTAANEANAAAQLCQEVIDGSGVILKESIVDNTASTSTDAPLSANQGRVLQEQIDQLNESVSSEDIIIGGKAKLTYDSSLGALVISFI